MTKNITLKPGDMLVINVPIETTPPEIIGEGEALDILLTIPPVVIYHRDNGAYVCFVSNLDVCNDGCGPAHGDQHHQSMTAYCSGGMTGNKYLHADVDPYIVVPPQIRRMVPGVVMGCRGRVTNLITKEIFDGVVGDIGPDDKTGETAYILAKALNPMIEHNVGDSKLSYLYELWPDVPATIGDFTYRLQPA